MIHDLAAYLQPMPAGLQVASVAGLTVITRSWRPGDPDRCTLCPCCSVNPAGSFCTIVVRGDVRPEDAALYRLDPDRRPSPRIHLN
jgi:hypothetical protein